MSFLTPAFLIAGLAAVSLPIVFHMIRRTPKGRVDFSTIMFLEPSPPKITRRSKIENWPLLLLRALALTLLGAAFGRPFLREILDTDVTGEGVRTAILIDTSASMRRDNLWQDAVDRAVDAAQDAGVADQIGLFAFDRELKPVLSFDEWSSLEAAARVDSIRARLTKTQPGWAGTDVAQALIGASEYLDALSVDDAGKRDPAEKRILLISDLQSGSRLDALQGFEWPEDTHITIERVTSDRTANAGLQVVGNPTGAAEDAELRIRVTNAGNSSREQFRITWGGESAADAETTGMDVYVPPGRSRIVRPPAPPEGFTATHLTLDGDDHSFDNTVYVSRIEATEQSIIYVGADEQDNPRAPLYYVERAFPDTPQRKVAIDTRNHEDPAALALITGERLIIVSAPLSAEQAATARKYAEAGGTLLLVATGVDMAETVAGILDREQFELTEPEVDGYAMLTEVDFEHPLFAPFNDPRFADFTGIHVWHYRETKLDDVAGCRVLARFDSGAPALAEVAIGEGRAVICLTGWHPQDSQLALSSKFPALMNGILDLAIGRQQTAGYFAIGDPVALPEGSERIRLPDGNEQNVKEDASQFRGALTPGLYSAISAEQSTDFVVNVASAESRTSPLPLEELESLGVPVTQRDHTEDADADESRQRQLQAMELEQRQKFWRWLIAVAIVVLLVESWLGGWMAKRQRAEQ